MNLRRLLTEKQFRMTVLISVLLGILYGVVDAALDAYVFYGGQFLELAIYEVPPHEIYVRGISLAIFVAFGVILGVLRHHHQQELQHHNDQDLRILQGMGCGLITTDCAGNITFLNTAAQQLTGWREGEATGKHYSDVFRIPAADMITPVIQEHRIVESLDGNQLVSKEGHESLITYTVAPRYHSGNISGAIITFHENTPRDELTGKIRENEELHRLVLREISDTVLITDDQGEFTYVCPNVEVIFGYTPQEVNAMGSITVLMGEVQMEPSEVEKLGELRNLEHTIIDKSGHAHHLLTSVKAVDIQGGTLLYTCRDISDRKAVEEELQFHSRMLNQVGEAVIATDPAGEIIYWNTTAEVLYGWSRSEAVGKNVVEVTTTPEVAEGAEEIIQTLRNGQCWSGTFPVRRKDGSVFQAFVTDAPVLDSNGNLAAIIGTSRDISEQVAAYTALKESEAQFRTIFEEAPIGMALVDESGIFLEVNSNLCRLLGYSKEELCTKNWEDLTHPDDLQKNKREATRLISGEISSLQLEKRYITKHGTTMWANVSVSLGGTIEDRVFQITMIEDITSQKQAERALMDSETRFRNIWECSPEAMCLTDAEGVLMLVNPAFARLVNIDSEKLVGTSFIELFQESDRQEYLQQYREYFRREGLPDTIEEEVTFVGEKTKYLEITNSFMEFGDDRQPLLFSIIRDLTVQKSMEQELIQAQKLESLGEIAGGIAHDFNNVLTAIDIPAHIQETQNTQKELDQYIKIIQSSLEWGKSVTERMLTFIRSTEPKKQVISLESFLNDFKEIAVHTLPPYVNLRILSGTEPDGILADPGQLQQILFTLCINASDAMPRGGTITLGFRELSEEELQKHASGRRDSYRCLLVEDEGDGMNSETLHHIFEPFFTTKSPEIGTGLGLAVVKKLVHMHQGWIDVSSEPRAGTRFIIGLPAAKTPSDRIRTTTEHREESLPAGNGETLLLVEDERSILNALSKSFEHLDYKVLTASSGTEAGIRMKENPGKIDMLITDIGLPDMNGRELVFKFKALFPHAPVIVTTGYVDESLKDELYAAGVNKIVTKPFNIRTISPVIRRLFKQRPVMETDQKE